jgi:repressor LexA
MTADDEGRASQRGLSEIQARILQVFETHMRHTDRPPTVREIGQAVGISATSHIAHHLKMLEKRGYITHEQGISRGYQLNRPIRAHGMPILGTIAAGEPLDLFEAADQHVLPLELPTREGAGEYALRVRGDSMIEDGIFDGDYILVRRDADAHDGEIVVAVHLEADAPLGAATVKRLSRQPGYVRLQPANAKHTPRDVPAAEWAREWAIHGVVIGIYRQFR